WPNWGSCPKATRLHQGWTLGTVVAGVLAPAHPLRGRQTCLGQRGPYRPADKPPVMQESDWNRMSTLQQEPSALAPHTPAPNRRQKDRPGIVGARKSTLALAIFPALLLMVLFLGVPALQGVRMSF